MRGTFVTLAVAVAGAFMLLAPAEAAPLPTLERSAITQPSAATPVWWRRGYYHRWYRPYYYTYPAYGYYSYPAYGYYGGYGYRHHRRWWW